MSQDFRDKIEVFLDDWHSVDYIPANKIIDSIINIFVEGIKSGDLDMSEWVESSFCDNCDRKCSDSCAGYRGRNM